MSTAPFARTSIAGPRDQTHAEIDALDRAIERFVSGQIPEARFLEYRLRHGIYGQRQDGVHMMRSKLPLGLLSAAQLEAFADLTEAYSAGVAHLTTRQDIQVHFVPLRETPALLRVLADAEMTSREACGNVVRNVTASEVAGVASDEAFDVTGHGMALAKFLLRHPDGQNLGRKFKVTLAGSFDPAFNTGPIHDFGATAVVQGGRRGFYVVVGGGLGAVPHQAQLLTEFLPEEELLPIALSVLRVFGKHGEKKKRAKARLKFLVAEWGIERFQDAVLRERAELAKEGADLGRDLLAENLDGRWDDHPAYPPSETLPQPADRSAGEWLRSNALRQAQLGYASVRVRVPRGDLSPWQLRGLAELLRAHAGDTLRIAADQSLLIRFVPFDRLLAVREHLLALELGLPRAGGLGDTVTCPGADSCKLGITSPRSVARFIEPLLDRLAGDPRIDRLRIKISGCPNSCAQHHIADIGLFGATRTVSGQVAPHYLVHVGGVAGGQRLSDTVDGLAFNVARVPALQVGATIERLLTTFLEDAKEDEDWTDWVYRYGRPRLQSLIADLTVLPAPDQAAEYYRELGRDGPFAIVRGTGECAGEMVQSADLLLIDADQRVERATQALLARVDAVTVQAIGFEAMVLAARALLSTIYLDTEGASEVVARFRERFYETGAIYEGVGSYFLAAAAERSVVLDEEPLRRRVVEAGLFVEEAHAMIAKMHAPAAVVPLRAPAKAKVAS
ncbi:MAG: nitrite/sulfite reductase [Deltaproteobacteria bacterium]|nr:nitrite/sulfite reductase [Deltaproteobacteria bacterium]